ncbi:MAG: L-threonylcarbamoyladenylate synthase [Sporolactobacillus sp.]
MIKTKVWTIDSMDGLAENPLIKEAAACLVRGEIIAFPTETVYGLGGNAKLRGAARKIYEAKGRPSDNPLIVHVATKQQVRDICTDIDPLVERLMKRFWPGPLTLILPSKGEVSDAVTAGLSTVAVRMPEHLIARALILAAGVPIAAPSANLSGHPSPTTAAHVLKDLDGRIAGIIDGGPAGIGVESTIVDCTRTPATILRPGGISREQLVDAIGAVSDEVTAVQADEAPKAPGMKYRHYAPQALLYLVPGGAEQIQSLITAEKKAGRRVGVLTTEENRGLYLSADAVVTCGSRSCLPSVAGRLFAALREFDDQSVDVIYSETFSQAGIGRAIMNRLSKASGGRIIR